MNDLFYCNIRQDMDNLKGSARLQSQCAQLIVGESELSLEF